MKHLTIVLMVAGVVGCSTPPPLSPYQAPPEPVRHAQVFEELPQPGQVPSEVLNKFAANENAQPSAETASFVFVAGPISIGEDAATQPALAGAADTVKSTLGAQLTAAGLTVKTVSEAIPSEDAARPKLAEQGIEFVIKGAVYYSTTRSKTTVLLRTVNTKTGKIVHTASGIHETLDAAIDEALRELLSHIK